MNADLNVICSMVYQRGEATGTPGLRTVSRKQIERVVTKYNEREMVCFTSREVCQAYTDRWTVEGTMQQDRFLIHMRDV